MFTKKELNMIVMGALATFLLITLSVYSFYINLNSKMAKKEPLDQQRQVKLIEEDNQNVMKHDEDRIEADTNVVFEIVDQLGVVTQTNMYPGVNWIDVSKIEMSQMYPDYTITHFQPDQVLLTRVLERQIEPDYVLTVQDGKIIIAIVEGNEKIFHKDTGLAQHDFSDNLGQVLQRGIAITPEQKEAILQDSDELYIIFQEYDE